MHLTLKTEAAKPAAANALQQQARFDAFIDRFYHERPHQALGMQVSGERYIRLPGRYHGLAALQYPLHDWTGTVTHCGRIYYKIRKST
jgi:putative transposase